MDRISKYARFNLAQKLTVPCATQQEAVFNARAALH